MAAGDDHHHEEKPHVVETIHVNATPEQVWSVLTDFGKLKEWSTSFQRVEGDMALGKRSTAYFRNPITHKEMAFEHEIVVWEEGRAFGWSGDSMLHRHDRHVFRVVPREDGTTDFRQEDGLYGKPSGFMSKVAEHEIGSAYKKFNKQLKKRVETLYPRKAAA